MAVGMWSRRQGIVACASIVFRWAVTVRLCLAEMGFLPRSDVRDKGRFCLVIVIIRACAEGATDKWAMILLRLTSSSEYRSSRALRPGCAAETEVGETLRGGHLKVALYTVADAGSGSLHGIAGEVRVARRCLHLGVRRNGIQMAQGRASARTRLQRQTRIPVRNPQSTTNQTTRAKPKTRTFPRSCGATEY